jgi:hypothetical protein
MATEPKPIAPRLAKWLAEYKPRRVGEALGVSIFTVYQWRYWALGKGRGFPPAPKYFARLIQLAEGALFAADIYPASMGKGAEKVRG